MKKLLSNWIVQVLLFLSMLGLTVIVAQIINDITPPYILMIGLFIGINLIMALGLNLITGVTGQLTLGHAAFMSIGAYASAIATVNYDLPFLLGVFIGGLVAGLVGIIIGFPTLRLTGDYLAIATLGFAEIVRVQFTNMKITNGAIGFLGIEGATTFPIVMTIAVIVICAMVWLENSRNGRAMLAIREDEVASSAVGINTTLYKIQAFAIGAFCAGVGGALFAHTTTFIQPTDFGFLKSIDILSIVVLGGLGSIPGTIIGAIVLTAAPEILRPLSNYRMMVYGVLLVVIMIFRPYGLMGGVNLRQAVRRAIMWPKKKQAGRGE
ncbi:branched-chain amino acid ABC transporter permease [Desulfosporosinus sp. BICA1-9]|uniref:branched-chain amino acid ABC transporter permease n=1 Tax=Desulfosporosinus sp. BICA1-9 TaxID=1531958 RepID=UPI00054C4FF2|nr:branched-chain amino acid ABC transporter permease [Desulfosporosinus sp. BICA1-9]KJS46429.1 MAG: branched-chain amino acid ABC transporter permease [Peptococcaceae bacterium BRH_c23]KJS86395.1 MAG: branched-chain amino acid ABC transporter permease [Desulfosporosinus sp. BICA1-9]HBW36816.1 branched-chain amino acid ABC transporter permease [Desulfosporosinus sp.]